MITAQIVDGLARAQNGTTTLTLSPEELGRVNLSFQQDAQTQDRLVVMLNFDRPETMDLFRRHADQLADALRAAGFAGVQIGFGGAGTGGTEHGAATAEASDSLPDGTSSTKDLTPLPAPSRPLGHGALDLRL